MTSWFKKTKLFGALKQKNMYVCLFTKTNFTQSHFVHDTDRGICPLLFAEPNKHLDDIYVLVGLCQVSCETYKSQNKAHLTPAWKNARITQVIWYPSHVLSYSQTFNIKFVNNNIVLTKHHTSYAQFFHSKCLLLFLFKSSFLKNFSNFLQKQWLLTISPSPASL
jgi:hypothetical protein